MNLILSLSTEARMVIAEIVALIGILIILFLYKVTRIMIIKKIEGN